ncbi:MULTISPECIES: PadR family transcriptional regulator [unclassified Blautia]|uniref:PadR family transcriptional regulator n=1 Tax=Candidatus Blautia merdigallinarum TaxID=2838495 RepID=A0A9D2SJR7_9FIRM|nr:MULTISPECIES: PadR family transcriptional regulator [unclassified Blautia]OUN26782.1 PadR family transcriptional regulator [Blautia sp. An81]OUN91712.1 PadR family transcriptional regulator [Blautia sp. An46]HJC09809.1 PadR family transcriptional regulator [Candidatus Blautia merdigallinarum]HJD36042.1 PadR family transcriptional regulator [Candidatus Blautia ornithocaccae]
MAREQFQTLTEPMYYILLALTEECCGVDIMEKVRKISGGRVKVGPGTLYAMLSKFEKNQIIRLTGEENRRKSYIITEAGRKMLLEEYERLKIMAEDGRIFIEKMKNQKK